MDLARALSEEHELPFVPVYIESAGGFWLTVRKDEVQELPRGCINVSSKGAKWRFTTMELVCCRFRRRMAVESGRADSVAMINRRSEMRG